MRTLPLSNSGEIPVLGLGTWRMGEVASRRKAEVAAVREAIANKDLRQKMINLGFEPDGQKSPAEVAQFVKSETNKWGKVVRERNIKVE